MRWCGVGCAVLLSLGAWGCASPAETAEPDPSISAYVLESIPADVQNRTLVDFGGAVHLVGYDIEPRDRIAPGDRIKLKLYWRSVKRLSAGWSLFTHLDVPGAPKPYAFDGVGPLRAAVPDPEHGRKQKVSPSDWRPGLIYVDEQDIRVPDDASGEVTLSVGLYREPVQVVGQEIDGLSGVRLPILSGLSDGKQRALIARLFTVGGEKRPAKAKRKPGDKRPQRLEPSQRMDPKENR